MKIPMKWLKAYTNIEMDSPAYADKMIMTGTAVEGIENTGDLFDNVVVGHVVDCVAHPNSDHLHICQVDVGGEEPIQIVCGAPNVYTGAYVAVAMDGAHLPGGITIKKGKMRGEVSMGMLCSGNELGVPQGLYNHVGDAGILLFNEDVTPGQDVKTIFGLGDDVIEYEILANRPDLLSVWGVARESAAVLGTEFKKPEIKVTEDGKGTFYDYAKVTVLDTENCPRYCAKIITDVKIGPSPKWMREYLYGAGVRPINNIVDITNFVMLETGHPMHAFDLSKVKNQTIIVRRANPGETLTTLDGKTHTLSENMLVIADEQNATGLAGIMGGEESEIISDTVSVLFECAVFERANNRITARTLGIRTEASGRFEKGVCPATAMEALERACMLVNELGCGKVVPGTYDNYPSPAPEKIIEADVGRIVNRIGVDVSGEEMKKILNDLSIETELDGNTIKAKVPSFRQDIEGEADLSEEVLRMHGYDAIPSTLMKGATMVGFRSAKQIFTDRIKRFLIGDGFFETLNFSFVSPKWLAALELPEDDVRNIPVKIRNPLGDDTSVMRTTLVPSMLNTLSTNINRSNPEGKLFEIAPAFFPNEGNQLPTEKKTLVIGMYGDTTDFYSLKDVVMSLLSVFGIQAGVTAGGDGYYHPGRKAVISCGEKKIGTIGEIHPDIAAKFDIERRVYVAEIAVETLMECETQIPAVKALPKYPAVSRDIALVMDEKVGAGEVLDEITTAGGKYIEDVKMFDIYRGAQLGEAKKSVAYALSFRAADRTLTEDEVNSAIAKILKKAEEKFGAVLR